MHPLPRWSKHLTAEGAKGDDHSFVWAISRDGRFVVFSSGAATLSPDDGDTTEDVFVRDIETNTTTLVSRASGAAGAKGNNDSYLSSMSSDGRFVAFSSQASNLSPDDPGTNNDVFVRDLHTSTTTLVSRTTGAAGVKGNGDWPSISADGRFVAFESEASNLSSDDGDTTGDVFVRDLRANTTTLVSHAAGVSGAKGNDESYSAALSGTGLSDEKYARQPAE